ncbi:hypothetical protein FRX31_026042 [Thalictrum thalictroides]|uniref:Uncharacterized protein n=1 Tax=Thalictrum thalictroides TaxID=46969 RepID=A0A7J6VHJ1_THATH|nr:hypothetical protein FRX31_026042 [Thalictrum thalictroides]
MAIIEEELANKTLEDEQIDEGADEQTIIGDDKECENKGQVEGNAKIDEEDGEEQNENANCVGKIEIDKKQPRFGTR